ncbi:phospholipase D-like domain-containing protein (plasmid) [Rhizobium phaseoli]|uniref:phospholipase D-like domain-containing protein n=1 Tax=Rhizobium phaseoli TaxID=396 RepID=UPI0007EBD10E|nr:phospholipase D family protein [Rhizobium phaseoli]ANL49433.1 phospholipase D-like domain-containing protein [Rhizobium phaseoli]
MSRIFSNGPAKDFVFNPFSKLIKTSSSVQLAAPYFTEAQGILEAAAIGKQVRLLVGLNSATSPDALKAVFGIPGLAIRYLTRRFHAKIFVFDNAAMLGSSNLTDGGFRANREAVICLDREEDADSIEDIRTLFVELWEAGQVLTQQKLTAFVNASNAIRKRIPNADREIEEAVGKAEPPNINVASNTKPKERVFLQTLQREIYEQYRPAFSEVTTLLNEHGLRRPELGSMGLANEANRFLNYVRLTHVIGDEAWQAAPMRGTEERKALVVSLGKEWVLAKNSLVPENFSEWLDNVSHTFGTVESLKTAGKDEITQGLLSLHAFSEQLRFVKGGQKNLPGDFWARNENRLDHVRSSLNYLLHGPGDFIERFHDILYHPSRRFARFGYFSALELYGTVKPDECPPMNGRMAKALRYLGFDVKGA